VVSCSNVAFSTETHSDEVSVLATLLPRHFRWWFEGQTSPTESATWSFDTLPVAQGAPGWERGGDIQMKPVISGFLGSQQGELMLTSLTE